MNIIFINNGHLDDENSGGTESLIQIGKRLLKENINIIMITSLSGKIFCEKHNFHPNFIISDYDIVKTKNICIIIYHYLKRMIKSYFIVRDILKDKQNDILYATSDFLYDTFPIFFNKNKKFVILHMIYSDPLKGYNNSFSINYLLCFLSQQISLNFFSLTEGRVLYIHPEMKIYLSKLYNSDRISFISNGIDNNFIDQIKNRDKIYDGCWIGRVHPQKGIDDLFKIWNIVIKKCPDAKLVICGKGTEKLSNLVQKYNLNHNIIIKGYVDNETKIKVMKESKLFLYPSYYESWGITICEAMSCGTPVIAYDLSVYKSIFMKGIQFIPKGKIDIFSEKAIKLFDNDNCLKKLSKDAKDNALLYDWNMVEKRFLDAISGKND